MHWSSLTVAFLLANPGSSRYLPSNFSKWYAHHAEPTRAARDGNGQADSVFVPEGCQPQVIDCSPSAPCVVRFMKCVNSLSKPWSPTQTAAALVNHPRSLEERDPRRSKWLPRAHIAMTVSAEESYPVLIIPEPNIKMQNKAGPWRTEPWPVETNGPLATKQTAFAYPPGGAMPTAAVADHKSIADSTRRTATPTVGPPRNRIRQTEGVGLPTAAPPPLVMSMEVKDVSGAPAIPSAVATVTEVREVSGAPAIPRRAHVTVAEVMVVSAPANPDPPSTVACHEWQQGPNTQGLAVCATPGMTSPWTTALPPQFIVEGIYGCYSCGYRIDLQLWLCPLITDATELAGIEIGKRGQIVLREGVIFCPASQLVLNGVCVGR